MLWIGQTSLQDQRSSSVFSQLFSLKIQNVFQTTLMVSVLLPKRQSTEMISSTIYYLTYFSVQLCLEEHIQTHVQQGNHIKLILIFRTIQIWCLLHTVIVDLWVKHQHQWFLHLQAQLYSINLQILCRSCQQCLQYQTGFCNLQFAWSNRQLSNKFG